MSKPVATLTHVLVERRTDRGRYRWVNGFKIVSPEGKELQPYMPAKDARAFCKRQGWDYVVKS